MTSQMIIAIIVFIIVMALVASEKIHRGTAALLGAVILLITGIMSFNEAMAQIDFNTIGVLVGMMLFVGVAKGSGLFEYIAIRAAKISQGDPWRVTVYFAIITAVFSAFLGSVTTVLLVGPMTYLICKMLDINPIPLFLLEILASNIGGTATLIGDPPNIMIGSATGLDFNDFILNDGPVVVIILVAVILYFRILYYRTMKARPENIRALQELDAREAIKDPSLFRKSIIMIIVIILGFMFHGILNIESSVVALAGAGIMLVISGIDLDEAVGEIEWSTIGFFLGLFIVVGGLAVTGVLNILAEWLVNTTNGSKVIGILLVLWISAFVSAILDNVPYAATMIPVLLAMQANGVDVSALWWALSLGTCLGGNGTLIGASSNVVLSQISKRQGYTITFIHYLKVCFPLMIITVIIATVYCLVRYA